MFKGKCYTRQRRGFLITRFRQKFIIGSPCRRRLFYSHKLFAGSKKLLTVSRRASLYLNEVAALLHRLWTPQSGPYRHFGATRVYGPLL